jgi:aspartate racemase
VPDFISHTFLDELAAEVQVPIISIMDALKAHVQKRYPKVHRLGILTSSYVRKRRLWEQCFEPEHFEVIYPLPAVQDNCLMPAIYGPQGIKSGHLQGESVNLLESACRDLIAHGAELVVSGFTEIPIVVDALRERGLPVIDSNRVYAAYAVSYESDRLASSFKIGVVGGVGPAATVDFMNKVVCSTAARRDQDHIKVVVEQNPQIPDRTEHLIGEGPDPTVALYSTCKKLEASDADLIAIPCNTAHAFVERIQPYLSIPIVNMLYETVQHIRKHHGDCRNVGLLATSGTLMSRVYHEAIEAAGLNPLVPDEEHQRKVMNAIYGDKGVKAGYTEGECRQDLLQALEHLVRNGADVVILGCTELPLVLAQSVSFPVAGRSVVVLDPTEILAKKCVRLVTREAAHGRGSS